MLRIIIAAAVFFAFQVHEPVPASAQVLYGFSGGADGAQPQAGVVGGQRGIFYGTTNSGGGACDCGIIFRLSSSGVETVLHSFNGNDGANPSGALLRVKSVLYGTTQNGGSSNLGTVFKLKRGTLHVLHNFMGGSDGAQPLGSLVADAEQNLYGTASEGGSGGKGIVFRLDGKGHETIMHAFGGGKDGSYPLAGLVLDAAGNLFGTTVSGGNNHCGGSGCGTVFRITSAGTETVLYSFNGDDDGSQPISNLIIDSAGILYGTTSSGGNIGRECSIDTCGTVFKLAPDGTETVLHAFSGGSDGADLMGGLVMDVDGNLYGTTNYGGDDCTGSGYGCGTVFKIAPDGTEGLLYAFGGGSDGANPFYSGLMLDKHGNVFGTTVFGGGSGCGGTGCGVVFEVHH